MGSQHILQTFKDAFCTSSPLILSFKNTPDLKLFSLLILLFDLSARTTNVPYDAIIALPYPHITNPLFCLQSTSKDQNVRIEGFAYSKSHKDCPNDRENVTWRAGRDLNPRPQA
jgi:hypothetical protein